MNILIGYLGAVGTIIGLFGGYQIVKIALAALAATMGLAHAGIAGRQSRETILG